MKKALSILCALTFLAIATFGTTFLHSAEASTPFEEESTLVFRKALEEVLETEGITAEYITVTIEPVYDLNLDHFGFIYFMHYDNYEGFAIVINATGIFEVAEFFMKSPDPFKGFDGQKVYVGLMMYLVYDDGYFIDVESGYVVVEEIVDLLHEHALFKSFGSDGIYTMSETIHFINRTTNAHNLAHGIPSYLSPLPSSCVPVAGANIIGYWGRFFPNLVDFSVGRYVLGVYMYHIDPAGSQALINNLYARMGTSSQGTTVAAFRSGMTSYVMSRNRSISFTSTMWGNNFNFAAAQHHLRDGRPLAVFAMGFNMTNIITNPNSTTYCIWFHNGNHAMAGFGYSVITYTLQNGMQRTDRFIRVATGISGRTTAFFNINFNTQIYQVYAVNIF
jgi:hypothetical protein